MLNRADLDRLITHIENETGISLPESNYTEVTRRVEQIMAEEALTLSSYLELVSTQKTIYDRLMEVVTINETYFFREEKQFIYLQDYLFPELKKNCPSIHIWSASCSSGEEPLSLLILAKSIFQASEKIKVYGSDISQDRLDLFRNGIFRPNSFRTDGSRFEALVKSCATSTGGGSWKIDPAIIGEIDFFTVNLYQDPPGRLPDMDIIFLRNTLIYMNEKNKRIILDNVVKKLKPGGVLFLATAELPLVFHPSLSVEEDRGVYFFRKKDPVNLSPEALSQKIEAVIQRKGIRKETPVQTKSPVPHKKNTPREESIEDRVCRVITMDLNNEIYQKEEEPVERAASFIKEMIDIINRGDSKAEEEKLQEGEKQNLPGKIPGLFYYYRAFYQYRQNNGKEAEILFMKSLENNKKLWPARFYLTRLITSGNREIRDHLDLLIKEINEYINGKRYDYQFMLEGFNARYFLLICERRLSLEKEKIPHGR